MKSRRAASFRRLSPRDQADMLNVGPGQLYDVIWPARNPGKWLIHVCAEIRHACDDECAKQKTDHSQECAKAT